jgi:hypothetical protein
MSEKYVVKIKKSGRWRPKESAYMRVVKAMGAITLSREEGDRIMEYVGGAIHDGIKNPVQEQTKDTPLADLLDKRMVEYSDWVWKNLERVAEGKEPLPSLLWDNPRRKSFTYGDLESLHRRKASK